MMEDSTLHHIYNTSWALPCTVLSRSLSHESRLKLDPCSLTRSDEVLGHVQFVLHPQQCRPSKNCPSMVSTLSLTSESNSCGPKACHFEDCRRCVEYVQQFMMEDSTLHHIYNTSWALPCTVLSRSLSHESRLKLDPCSLTRSDEVLGHVQFVLHPQQCRPSKNCPSMVSTLSLTSESNSCGPKACHFEDCRRCTSLTHSQE